MAQRVDFGPMADAAMKEAYQAQPSPSDFAAFRMDQLGGIAPKYLGEKTPAEAAAEPLPPPRPKPANLAELLDAPAE